MPYQLGLALVTSYHHQIINLMLAELREYLMVVALRDLNQHPRLLIVGPMLAYLNPYHLVVLMTYRVVNDLVVVEPALVIVINLELPSLVERSLNLRALVNLHRVARDPSVLASLNLLGLDNGHQSHVDRLSHP